MRRLLAFAASSVCFVASPVFAQALPTSNGVSATFDSSTTGVQSGETLIADFDTTDGGVVCANPAACVIQSGSNGQGADTIGTGNYLAVVGNQSATFSFTDPLGSLGLDLGSADFYNSFVLNLLDGSTASFFGGDIAGSSDNEARPTGRLTFVADASNPITGLVLGSSMNSLETDNLSGTAAVPEPATWAMMLFGFGGIGFSLRRSRGKAVLARA